MVKRFLIDTDTASDDAVAIMMAVLDPRVRVEAITVVAGNVPLDQGTENALYTLEICGASGVPVYRGLDKPLLRDLRTAEDVHGPDGMGGCNFPKAKQRPAEGNAVDAIIDIIYGSPGEITLVTLGPLTNVAAALIKEPSIARKVKEIYIMGGTAQTVGNITPAAEYNVWVDPEAARIVFRSGAPITMVGWDVSRLYAVITDEDSRELKKIGTPLAHFVVDINRHLREFCRNWTKVEGIDCPDPVTVAIAIDETLATKVGEFFVDVETQGELTRGQTVVDLLGVTRKKANAKVVLEADQKRFRDWLFRCVS